MTFDLQSGMTFICESAASNCCSVYCLGVDLTTTFWRPSGQNRKWIPQPIGCSCTGALIQRLLMLSWSTLLFLLQSARKKYWRTVSVSRLFASKLRETGSPFSRPPLALMLRWWNKCLHAHTHAHRQLCVRRNPFKAKTAIHKVEVKWGEAAEIKESSAKLSLHEGKRESERVG